MAENKNALLALMRENGTALLLYREDVEALAAFDAPLRLRLLDAVFAWFLSGGKTVPGEELTTLERYVFNTLVARQERAANRYAETCRRRAEYGRKGGIASAKTRQAKAKQNEANEATFNLIPNPNPSPSLIPSLSTLTSARESARATGSESETEDAATVKTAVDRDIERREFARQHGGLPTFEDVQDAANQIGGIDPDYVRYFDREMATTDWTQTNGKLVTRYNLKATLRAWWRRDKDSDDWRQTLVAETPKPDRFARLNAILADKDTNQ